MDSKQEIWLLLGVCVCSECGPSVCGGQSSVAHEKVLGRTPVDSGQPQTPSGVRTHVQRRQKNCDHRRFFGVLSVKKLSSQQTPWSVYTRDPEIGHHLIGCSLKQIWGLLCPPWNLQQPTRHHVASEISNTTIYYFKSPKLGNYASSVREQSEGGIKMQDADLRDD